MVNSEMERITDIGTLLSRFQNREEERMVTRFHGIDRHKKFSTVSVLDRYGKEVRFLRSCMMEDYLRDLGAEDAVIPEASCGCFYWAEQIGLLVTIPGITPLTAAAFLADIGDVRRFKSLRQMNAYLIRVRASMKQKARFAHIGVHGYRGSRGANRDQTVRTSRSQRAPYYL